MCCRVQVPCHVRSGDALSFSFFLEWAKPEMRPSEVKKRKLAEAEQAKKANAEGAAKDNTTGSSVASAGAGADDKQVSTGDNSTGDAGAGGTEAPAENGAAADDGAGESTAEANATASTAAASSSGLDGDEEQAEEDEEAKQEILWGDTPADELAKENEKPNMTTPAEVVLEAQSNASATLAQPAGLVEAKSRSSTQIGGKAAREAQRAVEVNEALRQKQIMQAVRRLLRSRGLRKAGRRGTSALAPGP
eukprot:TRINITY_DN2432_c1_g1_i2.p1 TRINITY_DN2432_c1_g1~~TRINITY_DN2432_c1_g1_i2.p1  ORF type:complete len:249 (-),score=73.16 TRINITY_DN2432_c1_g1_i2:194-940(-)